MAQSHGNGAAPWRFKHCGSAVAIEFGVLIFHPEHISIGANVYVGHYTILKAYYKNEMQIGDGTWIGQQCFLHSAGGLSIGRNVGVGPGVRILTSAHDLDKEVSAPIMHRELRFAAVSIGDGCDIGASAVILPGVTLGCRVQVGAGAVVTKSFPAGSVVGGVPAKLLRTI